MLRNGEHLSCLFDAFPVVFHLLWRPHFKKLDLPPTMDAGDRASILQTVADSVSSFDDDFVDSLTIRLFEPSSPSSSPSANMEESYLVKRTLRSSANLRSLTVWWVCDDAMLAVVGDVCQRLEALDAWRSPAVTDVGLETLIGPQDQPPTPICSTLKRLGLKETSVSAEGCLAVARRCQSLESVTLSHPAAAKDFLAAIKATKGEGKLSLRTFFVQAENGDDLSEAADALPKVEDLRIWTNVNVVR